MKDILRLILLLILMFTVFYFILFLMKSPEKSNNIENALKVHNPRIVGDYRKIYARNFKSYLQHLREKNTSKTGDSFIQLKVREHQTHYRDKNCPYLSQGNFVEEQIRLNKDNLALIIIDA